MGISCLWMAGKSPVLHADECFFAICVLSQWNQHSPANCSVPLCTQNSLPGPGHQTVPGMITRRSADEVTLNRKVWGRKAEALLFAWRTVWVNVGRREGAFLTSLISYKKAFTPGDAVRRRNPNQVFNVSSSFHHCQNLNYRRTKLIREEGGGEGGPNPPHLGACMLLSGLARASRLKPDSLRMRGLDLHCHTHAGMRKPCQRKGLKRLKESVFAELQFQSNHPLTLQ